MMCELATQSVNGLNSYMHIFERTSFPQGEPVMLRGYLAMRFTRLPVEGSIEVYVTDVGNTLVDKGTLFKQKIKGPNANITVRVGSLVMPKPGEYRVWARFDNGEPIELCSWYADIKPAAQKTA